MAIDLTMLRNANIKRQLEWQGSKHADLAFRGLELAGEVGELCNLLKKMVRIQREIKGTYEERSTLFKMIEDEAADVLICLDLVCLELGINLSLATTAKFNATSLKHGLGARLLA